MKMCPHKSCFANYLAANIEFTFTPFNILFGLLDEDRTQLINTTILLAKIHIFKSQSRSNLNLRCLKSRLAVAQHGMTWEIMSSNDEWGQRNSKYAMLCFWFQPIFVCEMLK